MIYRIMLVLFGSRNNIYIYISPCLIMADIEVEELRGPFDTIIRKFRQAAENLESEGKDTEAQQFYLRANKIKEVKEELFP